MKPNEAIKLEEVLEAVAQECGVSIAGLRGSNRTRRMARPRQLAMYLMREHCEEGTLTAIGEILGGKDHKTVAHGCQAISKILSQNNHLRALEARVRARLGIDKLEGGEARAVLVNPRIDASESPPPGWITKLETAPGLRGAWNFDTTGNPGADLFANALQVWAMAQDRSVTVEEAAATFNVAAHLIEEAIKEHHWMLLSGNVIEHEGE